MKGDALLLTLLFGLPFGIQATPTMVCLAAHKSDQSGASRGSSKRKMAGSGFASAKTTNRQGNVPSLSSKAKTLLQRHGNNIDAASNEFFVSQIQLLLKNNAKSPEEIHAAKVAAAWDSVALFLPQDYARMKGKVEPHVERRLRHIVQTCLSSQGSGGKIRLFDVGCGDAALLNYLPSSSGIIDYNHDNEKAIVCEYVGIDISSEMIDLGLRQHPNANLRVGCFPGCMSSADEGFFDVILFNGSLQFFRDTRQVLQEATHFLTAKGRLVLCHVNGAKFVQEECLTNPSVAVRTMPNVVSLQNMAELLGMKVLDKTQLLEHVESFIYDIDGNADQFYLEALEMIENHAMLEK
jgi:SAM-dependent methyltransferase